MKFVFVGNTSQSMWNFRKDLMSHLKLQGHTIIVAAPKDEYSAYLEENYIYEKLNHLKRKDRNPFRDILLVIELVKLYKKYKPDNIFHYTIKPNLYGSIAAFLSRSQSYAVITGLGYFFQNKSLLTLFVMFMYKIVVILSKKVIFLNEDDIEDFVNFYILTKKTKKVLLLHGEGINLDFYNSKTNSLFSNSGEGRFIFIGRLLIDKGIREFVQAAKIIRNQNLAIKFHIIGPVDEGNPAAISKIELESYIKEDFIIYDGNVKDIRPYLAQADALILPSYGEGLSRVCLEALAMHKPIIATNIRGIKQLLRDNFNGFLVPKANTNELVFAINKFIHLSSSERKQMGENGFEIVKDGYSIEKVISFYEDLLHLNSTKKTN